MALTTVAAAAAATWAGAAYLDAKYRIRGDLWDLYKMRISERNYQRALKEKKTSPWYMIENACKWRWNEKAIWTRERTWKYSELYEQSLRYGDYMYEQGIRPHDLVGIYMMNSAEFIFIWFGCLAIGAAPAFINYNLEGKALHHCLEVSQTKLLFVDDDLECQARIEKSRQDLESMTIRTALLDDTLKEQISSRPVTRPPNSWREHASGHFPYALIYTSGTTGMPKGCPYTSYRFWTGGTTQFPHCGGVPGRDCWYTGMPLYHGTAAINLSCALVTGVAIALAPKFSVSKFWPDVHTSGATIFVYVGETARYLLNAPPHPLERDHKLRAGYGNGMRPDVWDKFQKRFNVPEIYEFFNSSEGLFAMAVWDKGPYLQARVGHHGLILRTLVHNRIIPVKIDHETGDIWRDPTTGFAKRNPYEEGGEMIVAVPAKDVFQGYWRNENATNKKFAMDVFKKGDLYYRTGDALRREPDGRWHFMDRLGDTYRWKSENVSTAEVGETLGHYSGIAEANVYGVLVPNHEGRAGCAAIHFDPHAKEKINYADLVSYSRSRLPKYAVPVFLRLVNASSHIHNHKQNKVLLRNEGVDPDRIGKDDPVGANDQIYWIPPQGNEYVPFERKDWEELQAGRAKL